MPQDGGRVDSLATAGREFVISTGNCSRAPSNLQRGGPRSLYFPQTHNAAFNLLKILFPDTKLLDGRATVETTSKKIACSLIDIRVSDEIG